MALKNPLASYAGRVQELQAGDYVNLGSQPSAVIARAGQSSVTGTTTKTAAVSFTTPGGTLGTNRCMCVLVAARFNSVSTTHTLLIEATYGGTSLWNATCTAQTAAATDHPLLFLFFLHGNGATNAQRLSGTVDMNTSAAGTSGIGQLAAVIAAATGFDGSLAGSSSVDSTVNQTFAINVQLSATTNTTFFVDYMIAFPFGEGLVGATGPSGPSGAGTVAVPVNNQGGASYTLVGTDLGKKVRMTNGSTNTVTIPNGVFADNDVGYVMQAGAGATTLASDGTSVLNKPDTLTTSKQYAWFTWHKISSSPDTFDIMGYST